MQRSYPKRERFFIAKFLQAMRDRRVATALGVQTYGLLSVIVSLEDDDRYRCPVEVFAEALMRAAGIASENTLIACRKRAVDAGWLHYNRGARGRGASYFVLIPDGELPAADAVNSSEAPPGLPAPDAVNSQRTNGINCRKTADKLHGAESIEGAHTTYSRARAPSPIPKDLIHTSSPSGSAHRAEAKPAEQAVVVMNHEAELIRRVAAAGVADAAGCVKQALSRGRSREDILAIVDHFEANAGRWEAGALHARIAKLAAPGSPAGAGWPPPRREWYETQAAARRKEQARAEIAPPTASATLSVTAAKAQFRAEFERLRSVAVAEQERFVRELLGEDFVSKNRLRGVCWSENNLALVRVLQAMHAANDARSEHLSLSQVLLTDETPRVEVSA